MKVRLQDRSAVQWDSKSKTAISVRDGVLEYYGAEIGMEPADKLFKVYRSPATIANVALRMAGIPLTNNHVEVQPFVDEADKCGTVETADMVDMLDESTASTLAIRNTISLSDEIMAEIQEGKRELSLGYDADMIPHDKYDFEQRDIMPYHLAVVEQGRCGPRCRFIDHKQQKGLPMKKTKLALLIAAISASKGFKDADGESITVEQIAELAVALPEALKSAPLEKLQEIWPALMELINMSKDAGVEMEGLAEVVEEVSSEEGEGTTDEDGTDPEKEKMAVTDSKAFKDALQKATDAAIKRHSAVVDKAKDFVGENYSFADKSTNQVIRDALASQYGKQKFADSELDLAFKMLRKQTNNLASFGDEKGKEKTGLASKVNALINQE